MNRKTVSKDGAESVGSKKKERRNKAASTKNLAATARQTPPGRAVQQASQGLHELLDVEEVARILGVNVRHVRRLVFERRIPYIKWGHLVRFDPQDLARWLASARRPAS